MSTNTSQIQQMKPYIVVAAVLFILLLVVLFWPSTDDESDAGSDPSLSGEVTLPISNAPTSESDAPDDSTEVFQPPQMPTSVVIGEEQQSPELLEPVTQLPDTMVDPVVESPEEAQLDLSDLAVKAAVVQAIRSPELTQLLVDDALLDKFVINVSNLANEELTLKDNLLSPPEQNFAVYNQAERMWIDRSSFQRYTPYVDAFESVDTEELLNLFEQYRPVLTEKFAEISRPNESLEDAIIVAIDELLNTPQVPVPIEVYSDSVMYKFADPKLESLSAPQKQMIRMGPSNMRRLKDVLRDVKAELINRSED
ncbi:DUF3014 domain-containing protein [Ningiella sp. W23]|uniref:DUF3014 domain-containing protein n=1 Tax=Ningiella sp. W23 TaxID=3023715 RepID=UPI0037573957